MDWNKLGERMKKSRAEREAEAARLAVDPGPPEATAVEGIRDWTKSIGVLYGTPTRVGDGWGVAIYPTRQQEALLEVARHDYEDKTGRYDDGYMQGLPAASIDKNGTVRTLTISDTRQDFVYDIDGNAYCRCKTVPRTPERAGSQHAAAANGRGIETGERLPEPAKAPQPAGATSPNGDERRTGQQR